MTQTEVLNSLGITCEGVFVLNKRGKLFSIINPGCLLILSSQNKNKIIVEGPLGYFRIDNVGYTEKIRRLLAIKWLIPCDERSKHKITELLNSPLSRSYSYLLNITKSVEQFIGLVDSISHLKVAVLGCGGIGCSTAFQLAGLGFRNFLLVDGDKIEQSNLNRQFLYSKKNIGKYKAIILKKALADRFDKLSIEVRNEYVGDNNIYSFPESDILVISADYPMDLYQQVVKHNNKPIFHGGYVLMDPLIQVYFKKSAKFKKEIVVTGTLDIPPSSGPINFKTSAILVEAIVSYLITGARKSAFQRLYYKDVSKKNHSLY